MVNIKNHAMKRYCERILGMTDQNEIKQYIVQNNQVLTDKINKMNEHSKFMYRGQLGDNITRIFRMADNVVLVLDTQSTCVITLYKCIFDFGEDMDRTIIKSELGVIEELNKKLYDLDTQIYEFVEQKKLEESQIEAEIKAMEFQLRILKDNKSFIGDEIINKKSGRDFTMKEVEKKAVRICNSLEYRKDLNEKAIG